MSIALMTTAWALELPSTDKFVLIALADNANDAGACWPSIATIARKCGLTERAVQKAVRRLEDAGHLSSVDRSGTSRLYTIHPRTTFTPEPSSPPNDVHPTPEPRSPKPSMNLSSTKTTSSPKKRARAATAIQLPDWVPADAWAGWIEMRKRKGSILTDRAAAQAIEKLRGLADRGHSPRDVLDQSTFRAWTGLFPIKEQDNASPASRAHSSTAGPRLDHASLQRRCDQMNAANAANPKGRRDVEWVVEGFGTALRPKLGRQPLDFGVPP